MAVFATRRALCLLPFAFAMRRSRSTAALTCPKPPRMELRAGRQRQRGARGSYCWGDENKGCCIDAGPSYPADQLYLYLEEAPELFFDRLGPVSELVYEIWPSRIVVVDEGRSWADETPEHPIWRETLARPPSPVSLPGDLPHGLYLIHVFADVASGGSTSQGFRVYVGPDRQMATPAAEATWPPPTQP